MLARLIFFAGSFAIAAAMLPSVHAQGVITTVEDFEGELPGPQGYPGGYSFSGGGIPPTWADDTAPPVVTEAVVAGGVGGLQAFEITIDSSPSNNPEGGYFYYGLGGFHTFSGAGFGFAQGQPGANNPANYAMTFDLKVAGAINPVPVRGNVFVYMGDYEAVFGVDLNSDGDLDDGFDIWRSEFGVPVAADNYANFNHVVWNLSQGAAPTADPLIPAPFFSDETTIGFQLYFNNDEFGHDAGNVVTIDNVALTFTPPVLLDGDFNGDGAVDGQDFVIWQRGESPTFMSQQDLDAWRNNFTPAAAGAAGAVPEPAGALLAAAALAGAVVRRRRA